MPGIIVTPGTSWPALPPAQAHRIAMTPPAMPAPRKPRRLVQYQSRPRLLVTGGGDPGDDFNYAPMVVPNQAGTITKLSSLVWWLPREVTMVLEWMGLHEDVAFIRVNGGDPVEVVSGSTRVDVSCSLQVEDNINWSPGDAGLAFWGDMVDGQSFTASGQTEHADWEYDGPAEGVEYRIAIRTTAAASLLIELLNASAVPFLAWYVQPSYTITTTIDLDAETSEPLDETDRTIRLGWTGTDYTIKTPAGFAASPMIP